jgi:hypothetical protein
MENDGIRDHLIQELLSAFSSEKALRGRERHVKEDRGKASKLVPNEARYQTALQPAVDGRRLAMKE